MIDCRLIFIYLIVVRMLISIIPLVLIIKERRGFSRRLSTSQVYGFIFDIKKPYSIENCSKTHYSSCILSLCSSVLYCPGTAMVLRTFMGSIGLELRVKLQAFGSETLSPSHMLISLIRALSFYIKYLCSYCSQTLNGSY